MASILDTVTTVGTGVGLGAISQAMTPDPSYGGGVNAIGLIGGLITSVFGMLFGPSIARATARKNRQETWSELPKMQAAYQTMNPASRMQSPYITGFNEEGAPQFAPPIRSTMSPGTRGMGMFSAGNPEAKAWKKALSAPQFGYKKPTGILF